MRRNQHAEFVTLNDDDAGAEGHRRVGKEGARELDRSGCTGLVQRRDTPRVSRQRCGLDEAHTHCPAWSPSMWRYGDPDADLKSLVLRSKTPRASGALELLSYEPGEPEVELGDGAVGTPLGWDRSDSSRSMTSLDDDAELMDSRLLTLAAQLESNREVVKGCRRDQERSSLWVLVNTFVHRGMEGVFRDLVDETGSMRSGVYHIDVRLSIELVEDNVGPRAKHVIPFSPDEHRSGIRVGHDVWSPARCRPSLQGEGRL